MTTDVFWDLREVFRRRRFWLLFGLHDAGARFRRTAIGGFFYSLNTLLRVTIIAVVFGSALGRGDGTYFGYVALGIPIFGLLSASVTQGYAILTKNRQIMQNMPMPVLTFVFRFLTEQIIRLGFSLLPYVGFVLFQPSVIDWSFLGLLIGIPLLLLLVTAIAVFCMVLSAFFPNLYQMLNAGMAIMFFATPVFWYAESRHGVRGLLARFNPFAHMLAIVRDPALGQAPPLLSVVVCIGLLIAISGVAIYFLRVSRPWLIYRI